MTFSLEAMAGFNSSEVKFILKEKVLLGKSNCDWK